MPTYQYACTECSHSFEQFQSFSDDTLTECPECSGRLRKLFNAVGVVFKGSGFYRNDSRGTHTSTETSATSGSGEGGSDTKTEKKVEKPETSKKSEKKAAASSDTSSAAAS